MATFEPITVGEFYSSPIYTGAHNVHPQYAPIYMAIRSLSRQTLPGIKVELGVMDPAIASKKAHVYSRPRGMKVKTRTDGEYLYILRKDRG